MACFIAAVLLWHSAVFLSAKLNDGEPVWYLICTEDRAFDVPLRQFMGKIFYLFTHYMEYGVSDLPSDFPPRAGCLTAALREGL